MERERQKTTYLIIHLISLIVFGVLIVYVSVKFAPPITRLLSHPEEFKKFIDSYGSISALIYILAQVAHVIIVVIPGEIVQIAGGYVFGTVLGTIYSVIGIFLGTVIVFAAVRSFGYSLVKAFVSPKKLEKFDFLINNPKTGIAIFVLFLLPGVPKDTLVYISGLTPIKPARFLLISTIARFPGLLGSAYIGANLREKDYLSLWIITGIALVLFVVVILARDPLIKKLHRP